MDSLKIITLGESLGGVESLINHVLSMVSASVPAHINKQLGITSNFLRFSVGIENVEDLKEDLN